LPFSCPRSRPRILEPDPGVLCLDRRLRFVPVTATLLVLGACHETSDDASFLAPGANALSFAMEELALSGGVLAAREFEAGTDQNGDGDGDGDGDGNDTLLRIVDLASGFAELVPNVGAHASGGALVAYTVPEAKVSRDLNGDGDTLDQVLHVFEAGSRRTVNVGFATDGQAPLVTAGFVVAVVMEADQGADLDGDGDALDDVLFLVE